jgi:hypothetical protein
MSPPIIWGKWTPRVFNAPNTNTATFTKSSLLFVFVLIFILTFTPLTKASGMMEKENNSSRNLSGISDTGSNSTSIVLKVFHPFEKGYGSDTVVKGERLSVFCNLSLHAGNVNVSVSVSETDVRVRWLKDEIPLDIHRLATTHAQNFQLHSDWSFDWLEATEENAGIYECRASLEEVLGSGGKQTHNAAFKWRVRVKDPQGFIWPLLIILAQVIILALITIACHLREAKREKRLQDIPIEKYTEMNSDSE